jgi:RNA polymerase sigma factor (sigma-70 family)
MPEETSDQELLAAYRQGDEEAAAVLFDRYYPKLVRLVARKTDRRFQRVEGHSDIVQSVLRSFFRRGRAGQIDVGESEDLWPILTIITLSKIYNHAKFWKRNRRDVTRDIPAESTGDPLLRDPSPEEAAVLSEIVGKLLEAFPQRRRRMLELLLDGFSVEEVVTEVGTSRSTVYNTRQAALNLLQELLDDG